MLDILKCIISFNYHINPELSIIIILLQMKKLSIERLNKLPKVTWLMVVDVHFKAKLFDS